MPNEYNWHAKKHEIKIDNADDCEQLSKDEKCIYILIRDYSWHK
jgi:hypothetical protein